jgi:divinyl protochlorophyllide a 8-vinyl-reductase
MLSAGLTFASAVDARAQAGLVGPNAVIQLAVALRAAPDAAGAAERVFVGAGFPRFLRSLPSDMVDEVIPARLFEALWRELPPAEAACIARDAGYRTGAYVLASRIPTAARLVLRALPPRFSAPLLLKAIRKHAWTFAGSGTCRVALGQPAVITIERNPLAMPGCVWHVGVFECLFRALVSRRTSVRHAECRIDGVSVCRFEIDITGGTGVAKDHVAKSLSANSNASPPPCCRSWSRSAVPESPVCAG